ncbi:MAG: hypothetical protein JNL01_09635 [Bdellovibrionales bacterium]|nr:hypothetical protein [Bdellovibrionales bacterium]
MARTTKRSGPKKKSKTPAKRKAQAPSTQSRSAKGKSSESPTEALALGPARPKPEACVHCNKKLSKTDQAYFVEEEIGRVFCSEDCIGEYFSPEVERLEKEYFRRLATGDLTGDEKEKYSHLRWITLEEPDEIWREKTLTGDHRYTLISEFSPSSKPVWSVCICLFLRGEPSFLYLAFTTKNEAMLGQYRRGERMVRNKTPGAQTSEISNQTFADTGIDPEVFNQPYDGLAEPWTEDETRRAKASGGRRKDDIPSERFEEYQSSLEPTLESPDEVWTQDKSPKIYQFIKKFEEKGAAPYWYVIVAKETEDDEEIELLEAFPTRDSNLVETFRRGSQEVGAGEEPQQQSATKFLH